MLKEYNQSNVLVKKNRKNKYQKKFEVKEGVSSFPRGGGSVTGCCKEKICGKNIKNIGFNYLKLRFPLF